LITGHIVEWKQALSLILGETLKNIDGIVDLSEKIVGVKVPVMISASLEDDLGFPGEYSM